MMSVNEDIQYDIKVINACKSYGRNNIINRLNMSVQSGSMYGLLGPSGCGKSTLLQCILGSITLDSGSTYLKADTLKDIGYMPQDLCLEVSLTINELFDYYGTLYDMKKDEIKFRTQALTEFLQLPNKNERLKNLSGGQLRRVSLAVSIFHDPKIIILDEPTVGIDPLLRQRIWDEFSTMVKYSNKTIIITTHYIEEATKANCIGLMRKGVLIEEGEPKNILAKYETDSLESAFLKICCTLETHKVANDDVRDVQQGEKVYVQNKNVMNSGRPISFNRIKALIKKNVNLICRDYLFLALIFLIPIIQSFCVCIAIGTDVKNIKIAVKSEEIKLSDCYNFKIDECFLDETSNQTMSCFIMNYLQSKEYQLVEVEDKDEGETMMKNYETLAFLYFSQNYTTFLRDNVGDNREDNDFTYPVYMHISKDNYILKNSVLKDATDAMNMVTQKTLETCSYNPKSLQIPIEFVTILGKDVKLKLNNGATLFFANVGFYTFLTYAVNSMISERMDGNFRRSMYAGVKIPELLISLLCICNIIYVLELIPTFLIFFVLFANPLIINSSLLVVAFLTVFVVSWIAFFSGIIIAGVMPTKLGCTYAEYALFLGQAFLSGFVWPINGQIFWLKPISEIQPVTLAGNTLTNIGLRGWMWNHPAVMFDTALLFTELILLILALFVLGKFKKDMWIMNK